MAKAVTQPDKQSKVTTTKTDASTERVVDTDEKDVQYPVSPEFWDDLLDNLPPWLDEIVAITLLIFGILSFLAIFYPSNAVVAVAWADILTSLFGYGSLVIAFGFFVFGIIILLPKIGVAVHFPPNRILASEIIFLASLAILHLYSGQEESRALARAGQGGGLIGWGISFPFMWLLGQSIAIALYSVILVISVSVVIGIKRTHIIDFFHNAGADLQILAQRLLHDPDTVPIIIEKDRISSYLETLDFSKRQVPIMRIRPNPENMPPSRRIRQTMQLAKESQEREEALRETLFGENPETGQLRRDDFNMIGELQEKKKSGIQWVERPDGRLKRYFQISQMQETKKVNKRDKDLPDLEIFDDIPLSLPDEEEINRNVVLIENTLLEFDINIDVVDVQIGPTVTRYAVQPFLESGKGKSKEIERTRVSKIASLSNDIALALSAKRLRLETPVAGHSYMGVEVPNKSPSTVALRSAFESKTFFEKSRKSESPLMIPLGRDVAGEVVAIDLNGMPHLLIAGTTGSGKSVAIAAMATALIMNNTPDTMRLVMLDPKMVELSRFNGIPHLIGPVETDLERIVGVLRWCTREMDRRYKLLEENDARNIAIYNAGKSKRKDDYLPYIVIMVDEIGDLMMSKPEETERSITRLAQMARAVGMHLVVATQRPSVDVLTGLIKANFPARISFAVASGVDSRVILDSVGAENLLGQGDMLYLSPEAGSPIRVQGCYVSDKEVRDVVQHWKDWLEERIKAGKAERVRIGPWERGLTRREFLSETDPMLEEAIATVVEEGEASASMIQRKLGLGYPRAARIMDLLEEIGVVGEAVEGGRSRKVLLKSGEDPFKEAIEKRMREEQ